MIFTQYDSCCKMQATEHLISPLNLKSEAGRHVSFVFSSKDSLKHATVPKGWQTSTYE